MLDKIKGKCHLRSARCCGNCVHFETYEEDFGVNHQKYCACAENEDKTAKPGEDAFFEVIETDVCDHWSGQRTFNSSPGARVFLSGPMTGIEDYNFPLFNSVAQLLREAGYEVVNPVDICLKYKKERVLADKAVFNAMIAEQQQAEATCSLLVLLPGWENSKGVRLELKTACERDIEIIQWEKLRKILSPPCNPDV